MYKKQIYFFFKSTILGFCLYLIYIFFFVILFTVHWLILTKPPLNDDFEIFSSIILATLLIKKFYKNITKESLLIIIFFYSIFSYFTICRESENILSFIQINFKYIILIPLLPIVGYFLPDIISNLSKLVKK